MKFISVLLLILVAISSVAALGSGFYSIGTIGYIEQCEWAKERGYSTAKEMQFKLAWELYMHLPDRKIENPKDSPSPLRREKVPMTECLQKAMAIMVESGFEESK